MTPESSSGDYGNSMREMLWAPGQNIDLNAEFPMFPPDRLIERWQTYSEGLEVTEVPGIYGAMSVPNSPPLAYASIDVDEVLRKSAQSLHMVEKPEEWPIHKFESVHRHAQGLSFGEPLDRRTVLKVLMSHNLIPPVENITGIAAFMRQWRKKGVYVFANTATKAGCEEGTLAFLDTHLPGCLDAVLFCSSDQNGQEIDKGKATELLLEAVPNRRNPRAVIQIDDLPGNNSDFRKAATAMQGARIKTFLLSYPTHLPEDPGSELAEHPQEAFRKADTFLTSVLPGATPEYIATAGKDFWRVKEINKLPEAGLLVGADVAISPEAITHSPADLTAELDRTECAINCLRYGYQGRSEDYAALIADQRQSASHHPELDPLRPDQFAEFHSDIRRIIPDEEVLGAMEYLLVTHDALKNKRILRRMGLNPDEIGHDEAFYMMFHDPRYAALRQDLFPTLDDLSPRQRQFFETLSAIQFDYAKVLQGEVPAGALQDLPGSTELILLKCLEGMLDIAGAKGNEAKNSSLVLDAHTYQNMKDLKWSLTTPALSGPIERYAAYIRTRGLRYGVDIAAAKPDMRKELFGLVRIACMQRFRTPQEFAFLQWSFNARPTSVRVILTDVLNRNGITDLAAAIEYGPAALRVLFQKLSGSYLDEFAHLLQEASIASPTTIDRGLARMTLRSVAVGAHTATGYRFVGGQALNIEPMLVDLENLPTFNAEGLRGKRVLAVGMGSGTDTVNARQVAALWAQKFGCIPAGAVSIKRSEREVRYTSPRIGQASKQILSDTEAIGGWRFPEKVLATDNLPVYLLHSTNPDVVRNDLAKLAEETGASVIVGVDPGGDSLTYGNEILPSHLLPWQDHMVIGALASLEELLGIQTYTAIMAPGTYSSVYARQILHDAAAARLDLGAADVTLLEENYQRWGMKQGAELLYGTTASVWLKALLGHRGLQSIDLPESHITAGWRNFYYITDAMAGVVIMKASKHRDATQRH